MILFEQNFFANLLELLLIDLFRQKGTCNLLRYLDIYLVPTAKQTRWNGSSVLKLRARSTSLPASAEQLARASSCDLPSYIGFE
jgi:hypothetical protein